MDDHHEAAQSSHRRDKNTSDFSSFPHPDSESRPLGVAAGGQGIVETLSRIADAVENLSRSVISALPPEALSIEDAARFLGVDVPAIKQLVRTRKLAFVKIGTQRGRVLRVEDLRSYLKEYRVPCGEETPRKKRSA